MVSLSQFSIRTNFHTCDGRKMIFFLCLQKIFRSWHPELFLGKGVLEICSKLTVEHPCRSVISMKLLFSFIEVALRHGCSPVNLLDIFRTPFTKNNSGRLFLNIFSNGKNLTCLKGTNIFSNNLWQFTLKYLPFWRRIWMERTELVFTT